MRLYRPGLNASGQRIAVDPVTGQQLAAVNIGRIVPNSGNLTNGIGQSGDAGVPDRLIEDNGILFAPRFGLTYDITGNQSFIFRAGGGVFYDRYEGNISFALISNPPTTFTPRIDFGRLQEIDPANALLAPSDLNAQAVAGQVPTTYNFNAGFQKKLPGGVIWDIAYVGSIANHLPRQVNLNAVPYGARFLPENQDPTLPASTLPGQNAYDANFLRPYQGYGNINLRLYDANSNYHGLQTQVDRRFANGLFLNANYTFSKALDTQDLNTDFSRPDQHDRAGQLRARGLRPPPHLQLQLGLPAAEEWRTLNAFIGGPRQQLAGLGRLPPRERPALRPDLERQRHQHADQHRRLEHGERQPADHQRGSRVRATT